MADRSPELTLEEARKLHAKFAGTLLSPTISAPQQDEAVRAIANIALAAQRRNAGWGRLRLQALRELGRFLIRNGARQGRPAKTSAGEDLQTLARLGITDHHISADAKIVARINQKDFDAYLAQEGEPTLKGLRRFADPAVLTPALPTTAKIGKNIIDLAALSPAAQEQIRAALADGSPGDYEPPEPVRNVRTRGGITFPTPRDYNVYTGDALAKRIVDFLPIGPNDFCIDPCRGRGAFYNALPKGRRDWAEIREGRNFLTYDFARPVDWCIGNFPWNADYTEMARRALAISKHVVQLVKLDVALNTSARMRHWREACHGVRQIIEIPWKDAEFVCEDGTPKLPEGFPLVMIWGTRGWPCIFQYGLDRPAAIQEAAD